jgi:hypothetical protein
MTSGTVSTHPAWPTARNIPQIFGIVLPSGLSPSCGPNLTEDSSVPRYAVSCAGNQWHAAFSSILIFHLFLQEVSKFHDASDRERWHARANQWQQGTKRLPSPNLPSSRSSRLRCDRAGRGSNCAKPKSMSGWRPSACTWPASCAMSRAKLCCSKWRRAGSILPNMCGQKRRPRKSRGKTPYSQPCCSLRCVSAFLAMIGRTQTVCY